MPHAVIFDLEFTAWPGSMQRNWMAPGEFKEIVQIGAVKVDAATLVPISDFECLVKPRFNPVISNYLEQLTGITNDGVANRGVDFADAFARFVDFTDGGVIAAFGRDDLVFEENIQLYGLRDAPSMPRYKNVIPWLLENGIDPRGKHACDVAFLCGAQFMGRKHDALDDARSVTAGIAALIKRGGRNILLDSR
jgi:inhibitor of KinA sporulation pathway (predicted exonuclease)